MTEPPTTAHARAPATPAPSPRGPLAGPATSGAHAPVRLTATAAAAALVHISLGVAWTAGLWDHPFRATPGADIQPLLAAVPVGLVGSVTAVVGAVVLAAVVTAARPTAPGRLLAVAVPGALWPAAGAAVFAVPDQALLTAAAYTPLVLVGTPFDWPSGVGVADLWPWPVTYQALSLSAGLAWAATAVVARRAGRGACVRCGRGRHPSAWAHPRAAARWGRLAVGVAVAVPLLYAATRLAWALGVPLGISEEVLREGQQAGLWARGAALAALAIGGAALTVGLHRDWGATLPRWVPWVGGRRIPPALATVPAFVVAALVTSAGVTFVRLQAVGAFDDFFAGSGWAVIGPELLWPVWGAALAAAALAYHLRRRGPCQACGRGDDARPVSYADPGRRAPEGWR